eukprot:4178788-Prymnesium_polylepis.1
MARGAACASAGMLPAMGGVWAVSVAQRFRSVSDTRGGPGGHLEEVGAVMAEDIELLELRAEVRRALAPWRKVSSLLRAEGSDSDEELHDGGESSSPSPNMVATAT